MFWLQLSGEQTSLPTYPIPHLGGWEMPFFLTVLFKHVTQCGNRFTCVIDLLVLRLHYFKEVSLRAKRWNYIAVKAKAKVLFDLCRYPKNIQLGKLCFHSKATSLSFPLSLQYDCLLSGIAIFALQCTPLIWWKLHEIYICGLLVLSLFVCMSVLARNILSHRPCFLCSYVCNGLPRQAHPPKVKYSLSAHMNKGKANGVGAIRQNILLWEGVLVLEDHYIHTSRENKACETEYFWPIQTYIRAKRERRWSSYHLIVWEDLVWSSLFQNWASLKVHSHVPLKLRQTVCVTGSERLFRGNQIDWVVRWVSWFQVFSMEIKSNAVSKLFILVWSYEGMKVLDLGYEKRWKKFSIPTICHIFSNFPAVFRNAQVTNRHFLKHGFTQLRRTAHIHFKIAF